LTAGTSRCDSEALPSKRTTLAPGSFAIGRGIPSHCPRGGPSHSVPVEHRLSLVEKGLAFMKRVYAVINLALVLIVRVLAARKLGLPLCEIDLTAATATRHRTNEVEVPNDGSPARAKKNALPDWTAETTDHFQQLVQVRA
jgi:hypothetical protein